MFFQNYFRILLILSFTSSVMSDVKPSVDIGDEIFENSDIFDFNKNEMKKDDTQKLFLYLLKMEEIGLLKTEDFEDLLKSLKQDKIYNPLSCKKSSERTLCKDVKNSSKRLIHALEIENYIKNKKNIDLRVLEVLVQNKLIEWKQVENNKRNAKKDERDIDKLNFYKIEPGEYRDLNQLEKMDDLEFKNLTQGKDILFQGNKLNHVFKFAKFYHTESFELADILVPQSLFARLMGYNPTYSGNGMLYSNPKIPFDVLHVDGNDVNYKPNFPVSNVTQEDVKNFIKVINNKDNQKKDPDLARMSLQGKCDFDILTESEFNFLKYEWSKDFKLIKDKSKSLKIEDNQLDLKDAFLISPYNYFSIISYDSDRYKELINIDGSFYFLENNNSASNDFSSPNISRIGNDASSLIYSDFILSLKSIPYNYFTKNENRIFEKNLYFYDKIIGQNNFYSIIGNKKIFIKNNLVSNEMSIVGVSLINKSKKLLFLDFVKTFFDEKTFWYKSDSGFYKNSSEIKDKNFNNGFDINNLPYDISIKEISDIKLAFNKYEKDKKREALIQDDPFTHGILLTRKCK